MKNFSVIRIISENRFRQNSYLCFNENIMLLVDCGISKEKFFEAIKEYSLEGRRLNAIFLTHSHFDHITGLYDIWQEYNCDVYISKGCEDFIYDITRNASVLFEGFVPAKIYPECIKSIEDKESVFLGKLKVTAYKTTGHSQCSMCYLVGDTLFTGDTILEGTIGRTDLCGGSSKEMINSLLKVKKLQFESAMPGHGEELSRDMVLGIVNFYTN